jgi:hypothetical protein
MIRWFRRLSPRWQLAVAWVPSWGIVTSFISLVEFGEAEIVAASFVAGLLIGVSSYVYVIRSGGW